MRTILQLVSFVALATTIIPAVLFLTDSVDLGQVKLLMLIGTIGWFVATPLWMGKAPTIDDEVVVP